MAYGNEVWLALVGEDKILPALKTLGIDCPPFPSRDGDDFDEWVEDLENNLMGLPLQEKLKQLHKESLAKLGFTDLKPGRGLSNGYLEGITPLGKREFEPFELRFHWDPHEMNEEPEHALLGVALSGRYVPTYLDWRDPNGTLWPVIFNEEMLRDIHIVRFQLDHLIPILVGVPIVVVEMHY